MIGGECGREIWVEGGGHSATPNFGLFMLYELRQLGDFWFCFEQGKGINSLVLQTNNRGFIKSLAPGKLAACEDDFASLVWPS